jgi:hypothetical protein
VVFPGGFAPEIPDLFFADAVVLPAFVGGEVAVTVAGLGDDDEVGLRGQHVGDLVFPEGDHALDALLVTEGRIEMLRGRSQGRNHAASGHGRFSPRGG